MTRIEHIAPTGWSAGRRPGGTAGSLRAMRRSLRSFGKLLLLVALLGVGLSAASRMAAGYLPASTPAPEPADAWAEIRRPLPLFGLTGTDFAKLPLAYAALRNAAGGGRLDRLTFGDPHDEGAWLSLSLYRIGGEAMPAGTIGDDVAGLLSPLGLRAATLAASTPMATRFGPFEAADARIAAPSGARPCLGFRSGPGEGNVLRMAGIVCGGADRPVGRDLLSCVIDRVDLLSAGDDESLRDLFVAAERRRGSSCLPAPLSPTASHTTWLDANGAAPILKRLSASPRTSW